MTMCVLHLPFPFNLICWLGSGLSTWIYPYLLDKNEILLVPSFLSQRKRKSDRYCLFWVGFHLKDTLLGLCGPHVSIGGKDTILNARQLSY